MISEQGRVVAVNGDSAWVRTIRAKACDSCSVRGGCGQKVLASASGGRANQVLVRNHLGARVGDEVTIAIEESALLRASLLVYALPLGLMLAGVVAGQQWLPGQDAGAITGALAGLGAGFGLSRLIQARPGRTCEPTLTGVVAGSRATTK